MDMNREAVNAGLVLAGNQPLTDLDKKYKNSVYVLCKSLYLPTLFNSLTEVDWKCARKHSPLRETKDIIHRQQGMLYYDVPADCIKPVHVNDNKISFRADDSYIITSYPVEQLFYVFHNRNFMGGSGAAFRTNYQKGNRPFKISAMADDVEAFKNRYHAPLTAPTEAEEEADDFPEWAYTPYDDDFWQFFSYKFAMALVPRLRSDDGTAQRVQALTATADAIGAKAVQRERAAEANPNPRPKTWSEKHGLRATYGD
jgi:hypothetical protein